MGVLGDSLKKSVIRFAIALPLWLFCVYAIAVGGLIGLLIGVPVAIVAGMICAPAFCEVLAHPFGALVCPEKRFDRVPPRYSVAESKASNGRFEEAIEEYEKVLTEHPREFQAYSAMLDIAALQLEDPDRAARIYDRAVAAIAGGDERRALDRQYEDALEALQRTRSRQGPDAVDVQHVDDPF